jgi:hypothetical protein
MRISVLITTAISALAFSRERAIDHLSRLVADLPEVQPGIEQPPP